VKKIFFVFGTRPEAIKLAPVINEFKKNAKDYTVKVCVTSQHRELLAGFLSFFNIDSDFDLDIMKYSQNLFDITTNILLKIQNIFIEEKPDLLFVQGDTTTSFAGALSGCYLKIPVAHVEAGLRTQDKYQPFPEEINRRLVSVLTDLHFTPTETGKTNLINEGISETQIHITGNTVIDSLFHVSDLIEKEKHSNESNTTKLIVMTAHRRESFGKPIKNICNAIIELINRNHDIKVIYPVHPNPNILNPVRNLLSGIKRVELIEPLNYKEFIALLKCSYLIITDSGGIQEEAPSLGKPVLVLRNVTERPEAVKAGTVKVVGTQPRMIISEVENLLRNKNEYDKMARAINPYGDGKASKRIVDIVSSFFN